MEAVQYHYVNKLYACFLACCIYLILLILLMIDIHIFLSEKSVQYDQKPLPPIHHAAPIKYMPPHKPITTSASLKKNGINNQSHKESDHNNQKAQPNNETDHSKKKAQLSQPSNLIEHPAPIKNEPLSKKNVGTKKQRSRSKWFKEQTQEEKNNITEQSYNNDNNQIGKKLKNGFNHFIHHQESTYQQHTFSCSSDNQAALVEYEMFAKKFTNIVCNRSYQEPLKPYNSLIKPHRVTMQIMCDRARTIKNFRFIKPSYDPQINAYLQDLIYTIVPPQLPNIHDQEIITIPFSVEIKRHYHAHKIFLVPG